jgi:Protein of unknown function (DUF2934)
MVNYTAKTVISKPAKRQTAATSATVSSASASKPDSSSKPNALRGSSLAPVTAEMRRTMIAVAAYYIAEQRGFGHGREVEDWLLAEKQIDAAFSA